MRHTSWIYFLFCVLPLSAQEITVSEEIPISNFGDYQVVGAFDQHTVVYSAMNYEYKLRGLNKALKIVWEKELELERKQAQMLGLEQVNQDVFLAYSYQKQAEFIVKARKYDERGNFIDSTTIKNYGRITTLPSLEVIRSEDRSKLLLYYVEGREKLHTIGFDMENMTLLWEKSLDLTKEDLYQEAIDLRITDAGDMVVIFKKDNFRSNNKRHQLLIYRYAFRQKALQSYPITMQDFLSVDIDFQIDNKNNSLIASGLYGNFTKYRAIGYFYLRVPFETNVPHVLRFHEFTTEMLSELLDKKVKKNKGMDELSMREGVLRRDGGVVAIVEYNDLSKTARKNLSNNRPPNRQKFGSILIVSIHPDGTIHWETILAKEQRSTVEKADFGSFFLYKSPAALLFYFNDDIKYGTSISEYLLRGNGAYERRSVLNTRDLDLQLLFQEGIQLDARTFFIPSISPNRLKLVRFYFD